jgi:hypothetical protein
MISAPRVRQRGISTEDCDCPTSVQLQLEFLIHRTIAWTCLNYGELATISKNRLANASEILSN